MYGAFPGSRDQNLPSTLYICILMSCILHELSCHCSDVRTSFAGHGKCGISRRRYTENISACVGEQQRQQRMAVSSRKESANSRGGGCGIRSTVEEDEKHAGG